MAMTPKEQLEILAAYVAGETVQYQSLCGDTWYPDSICGPNYEFNFQQLSYRIKPKLLELWCNVYYGDSGVIVHYSADSAASRLEDGGRTVHMREVLGD